MIVLKSAREVDRLREANRLVAALLAGLEKMVAPGVTTGELDRFAEAYLTRRGARPAFKGYRGFPSTLCTSVNAEVVHGIPSERVLREGDIVSLDVGAVVGGYYGDGAVTLPIGRVSEEATRLLEATRSALQRGVAAAAAGHRLSDISHAVQAWVEAHGYSVVRVFVGHGIGRALHEEPQIPNFGEPGRGPKLRPGMVLAIEPMVNAGGPEVVVLEDRWTAVTKDGSLSAHFEHTVAITEHGTEILTAVDPQ